MSDWPACISDDGELKVASPKRSQIYLPPPGHNPGYPEQPQEPSAPQYPHYPGHQHGTQPDVKPGSSYSGANIGPHVGPTYQEAMNYPGTYQGPLPPHGGPSYQGPPPPHAGPTYHGPPNGGSVYQRTQTPYGGPTYQGPPPPHGGPGYQGQESAHGGLTYQETPPPHGGPAYQGPQSAHGGPTYQGTPLPHGSITNQAPQPPHARPPYQGPHAPFGGPTHQGPQSAYGVPTCEGAKPPHGGLNYQEGQLPLGEPTYQVPQQPLGGSTYQGPQLPHGGPTYQGQQQPLGGPTYQSQQPLGGSTYQGPQQPHGLPTNQGSVPSMAPQYGDDAIEWILTTTNNAPGLINKAVVGGFEATDGSPLWVIRARFKDAIIPGKLAIKRKHAYIPWQGKEKLVKDVEVCCARPERVRWVLALNGSVPPGAVVGGNTATGEPLYVARAQERGSLTPGMVQRSHNTMYLSYAGKEIAHKVYEILCIV